MPPRTFTNRTTLDATRNRLPSGTSLVSGQVPIGQNRQTRPLPEPQMQPQIPELQRTNAPQMAVMQPQQAPQANPYLTTQSTRTDVMEQDVSSNIRDAVLRGKDVDDPFAKGIPNINPITGQPWRNPQEREHVKALYQEALQPPPDKDMVDKHRQMMLLWQAGQPQDPDFGRDVSRIMFGKAGGSDAATRRNLNTPLVDSTLGSNYKTARKEWDQHAANVLTSRLPNMNTSQIKSTIQELFRYGGEGLEDHMRNRIKTILDNTQKGRNALSEMRDEFEGTTAEGNDMWRGLSVEEQAARKQNIAFMEAGLMPEGMKPEELGLTQSNLGLADATGRPVTDLSGILKQRAKALRDAFGLTDESGDTSGIVGGFSTPEGTVNVFNDGTERLDPAALGALPLETRVESVRSFLDDPQRNVAPDVRAMYEQQYEEALKQLPDTLRNAVQTKRAATVDMQPDPDLDTVPPEVQSDPQFEQYKQVRQAQLSKAKDIAVSLLLSRIEGISGAKIPRQMNPTTAYLVVKAMEQLGANAKQSIQTLKNIPEDTKKLIVEATESTVESDFERWKKNRN